jgi:FkbM family methyltransferase
LKSIIHKITDRIAHRFGYVRKTALSNQPVVDTYGKNNLLHTFYGILKSARFHPKHIVDVGANHGTWTREALQYFPGCRFTLLEPQAQMQESVKDLLHNNSLITFHTVGAGKTKGTFNFTIVDRDDSCSFAYTAEEAEKNNFQQVKIPVVTLNEFIAEQQLPLPDIIKIDAEGLDIDVLEGANNFFGKTEIFMVEAGIVNRQFSNSFLRVINFMDEHGYRLFDITDLNRPFNPAVLWLTELVFVKKNGMIDSFKWI